MATVPIKNDTDNLRWIGGICIPPGEIGHIPAELMPTEAEPEAAEADIPPNPLAELLSGKAADVIAVLPTLTLDELIEAEAIEGQLLARKSVLTKIAELRLQKAAEVQTVEPAVADAPADLPPAA